MWEKINKIFPSGGTFIEGTYYTNEQIARSNLSYLKQPIYKPVREMIESESEITYYSNGDLIVRNIYNVFPRENINNKPLLNVYGFKMLKDMRKCPDGELL